MEKAEADISPFVDENLAKNIVEEFYDIRGDSIQKLDGYDDLNFHIKSKITTADLWPHGYVLKIINTRDSKSANYMEQYVKVLLHLNNENFPCPYPLITKNNKYYDVWIDDRKDGPRRHLIVMLTYIEGELLANYKCDEKISLSMGYLVNKLHSKLMPFPEVDTLKRHNFPWALEAAPKILTLLNSIEISEERRQIVINIVTQFENEVLATLSQYERGLIHGDVHDRNVVVERRTDDENNAIKFVGLLDFGDMVFTAYLFEVATALCYLALNNMEHYISLFAWFLKGYERRHLTETEIQFLKLCICARLSQSVVLGLHAHSINPTNEYLLDTQKPGWELLSTLYQLDNEEFIRQLKKEMLKIEILL